MPREALPRANVLSRLSQELTDIVGPALGGVLLAANGASLAFALDALSFRVSVACTLGMFSMSGLSRASTSDPVATEPSARHAGALDELREGLATVPRSPWLWITIAGVSTMTFVGPLEAALPLASTALLNALTAVGAVAAAIILGQAVKLLRRGALAYGMWLAAAVALLAMGLRIGMVAVGAICVCGAGIAILELVSVITLQELVATEQLWRVSSVDALGSYALLPVGYGLTGLAADRIGAAPVFALGGASSA
jgi:DHA3 family tetracycline resistance protein-like MFS transporter